MVTHPNTNPTRLGLTSELVCLPSLFLAKIARNVTWNFSIVSSTGGSTSLPIWNPLYLNFEAMHVQRKALFHTNCLVHLLFREEIVGLSEIRFERVRSWSVVYAPRGCVSFLIIKTPLQNLRLTGCQAWMSIVSLPRMPEFVFLLAWH